MAYCPSTVVMLVLSWEKIGRIGVRECKPEVYFSNLGLQV